MLPNMPRATWLDVVTEESRRAAQEASEDGFTPQESRRRLIRAIARSWPFPSRLVFRGYVVGARELEAPAAIRGPDGRVLRMVRMQRFLEVVPEGFTQEAFDRLGPILVPSGRGLMEGSVLTLAVDLHDPATYHLEPSGMLADLAEMKVDVAVEP